MESIENIGFYLKNLREERKLSIAQVAQALKTKLETIQELESNEFSKLPATTYVKGYLRSYANLLGIDYEHLIAEYNRLYPEPVKPVIVLQPKKLSRIGIDFKKILKPKLIISAAIIVILAISTMLFFKPHHVKTIKIKEQEKPQINLEKDIPKEIENPIPVQPVLDQSITTPISLTVQTIDVVWLRVISDGKLIFEGILEKGEKETWQAGTEFKLRIGNPGKLNLTINDKPIGNVSPYGPVNVVINGKGIKVEK